jgi:hypothetical protein
MYRMKTPAPAIHKMIMGIKYFFILDGLPMVDLTIRMRVHRVLARSTCCSVFYGFFAGGGVGLGTSVPAASFCRRVSRSSRFNAPLTRSTMFPSASIKTVPGIAWATPKSCRLSSVAPVITVKASPLCFLTKAAISGFTSSSSIEAAMNRILFLYWVCISLSSGISAAQGTHQVAQKFSTTGLPRNSSSLCDAPFRSWRSRLGAASPARAESAQLKIASMAKGVRYRLITPIYNTDETFYSQT